MQGIIEILQKYNNKLLEKKLKKYKSLSMKSIGGLGAIGCMIGALGLENVCKLEASNMDLRVLNRFSQRMALTVVNIV